MPAYAAQTTFFVLLSFFPFIMLLVMIVSKLSLSQANVVAYLFNGVPEQLHTYIDYIITDVTTSNANSFTIITVVVSLWSAAKGFLALMLGLNKIYGIDSKKNYFVKRFFSAIYTLIFIIICVVIMILNVFGRQIAHELINLFPAFANTTLLAYSLKNAFSFVMLFLLISMMYYQLPDRKGKVRHEASGAAFAALAFMLMTKGFGVFIQYISSASAMYGSLTSIVLIIIWLYLGMQIILYGAEVNFFMTDLITEAHDKHMKKKAEKQLLKSEKD